MFKVLYVVGARPNFMKVKPLLDAFRDVDKVSQIVVHTGQHFDFNMSDVFFEQLEIKKPDYFLGLGSLSREEHIEEVDIRLSKLVAELSPDLIIVVGDVNSTVGSARAASKNKIKLAHVESGLRSFDNTMPEEINRIETDELSDFLFVTEPSGMDNLRKEKIRGEYFLVGNVMIDTLYRMLPKIDNSDYLESLDLTNKDYIVSTFHRPSNVDKKEDLEKIVKFIEEVTKTTTLVIPIHPRTKSKLKEFRFLDKLETNKNLKLTGPLGYVEFIKLVKNSRCVVTDSGGIQEETTYLKVPCITMRENTERPVTITEGSNFLVGTDHEKLFKILSSILNGESIKQSNIPEFWDGKAAVRIRNIILSKLYND